MPRVSGLVAGKRQFNSGANNQVYNNGGVINTYAKVLANQKLQRDKEVADLTNYLGSAKMDGLRDADRDDYFEKYNQWRDKGITAMKEKDPTKRAILKSDADQELRGLNKLVKDSSDYNKIHVDVSGKMLDNKFRNQFTDEAVTQWQDSGKLPLSSPKIIKDPSTLGRQLDLSAIQGKLDKVDADELRNAKYENPVERRVVSGNKKGTEYSYVKRADPKNQAFNYATLYDTDRDFKAYVQKQYADVFDQMGDDEAKAVAIQDLVSKRPVVQQDKPTISWDQAPDNYYAHRLFAQQHPIASGYGAANGAIQTFNIPYNGGKSNVDLVNYVPMSITGKNFAGTDFYDLGSGKKGGKLKSSDGYSIVGVANAPFIKEGIMKPEGKALEGTISQPNFLRDHPEAIEFRPVVHVQSKIPGTNMTTDRLIDFNRLPENVRNSKQVREALGNFKPAVPAKTQAKTTPKSPSAKAKKTIPGF